MVPLPIALLACAFAALSAVSAVSLWKTSAGLAEGSPLGPLVWLAGSLAAMCGLALLRPWGRLMAVAGAVVLMLLGLAVGGVQVASGRPADALLATCFGGAQVIVIRYLRRPDVKRYFSRG
ncbi:MAG TPA: hypothetical protein VGB20_03325 [bacterium]